jgi:maltose O-acetyltransferase
MRVIWQVVLNLALAHLPVSHGYALKRWLLLQRGAQIGEGTKINGGVRLFGRGSLSIGERTWIGPLVLFFTHPDAPITIGAQCDIAPEVSFVTGTHAHGTSTRRAGTGVAGAISVGKGCWLGTRVTVLAGVRIGDGAVVAAGAVVADDVAPHTLVGGVPARLIRTLSAD